MAQMSVGCGLLGVAGVAMGSSDYQTDTWERIGQHGCWNMVQFLVISSCFTDATIHRA